jgi:hypothetical protein
MFVIEKTKLYVACKKGARVTVAHPSTCGPRGQILRSSAPQGLQPQLHKTYNLRMKRIKAEWEYFLWVIGWRKYCTPCDEIYRGWGNSHQGCRCPGLWRR